MFGATDCATACFYAGLKLHLCWIKKTFCVKFAQLDGSIKLKPTFSYFFLLLWAAETSCKHNTDILSQHKVDRVDLLNTVAYLHIQHTQS